MRAYMVPKHGAPSFTDTWQVATLSPDNVYVKVSACGLNFADLLMIEGQYQDTPPLPFVPGLEVCGEILSVGANVSHLRPGDRIAAFCGAGGLAETVHVAADRCRPVPPGMPNEIAAGFQIAYGTSHLALTRRARLQSGETLVVLGAAGGVGLTAVEIGHAMGARVIAVARGPEKLKIARAAGADDTIDSEVDDLKGVLRAAGGVDVVYDAVGGAMGEAALGALRPEGRFLAIGFASGTVPKTKLNHMLVKNIDVIGVYWGGYMQFNPRALTDSLSVLMDWYTEGRIHPHISHVLPFAQVPEALELLRTRKATGKVVVTL